MTEYRVFKRGGKEIDRTVDRSDMLDRVSTFLSKAEEARAWYRHREPADWLSEKRAFQRVANLTRQAKDGWRVLIDRKGDDEVLVIQKVEEQKMPSSDLGCNPQIEKAHAMLWARFGEDKLRSAGRWYCRYVDGTQTVSRHGYLSKDWQGAAEDIFGEGSMNNMAGLEDIAKFLVRQHEAGNVKLYTVIYGNRRWRAGEGWGTYGGVYHTHVHYDALGGGPCKP